MRLGFPGGDGLVSLPEALDLQPLLVIRAAAVTMTNRALVLKSPFPHTAQWSLFRFVQLQRSGIDTVTKIRRLRTVVEDMAQMSIALTA
jgi:hypothetical protein